MKPIRDTADHDAALAEIAGLMQATPGTPEADRLEILTVLVAEYERRTQPTEADPIDVLTVAMQAQGRSQADLAGVLGSRARASEVLARRRKLSGEMVERLAQAWSLPRALLNAPSRLVKADGRAARTTTIVLALVAVGVAGAAVPFALAARDLPDITPLVAEARGESLVGRLPPHVTQAFVSAEDERFLSHAGYDARAIVRAMTHNLVHGKGRPAGGATLTQQVVKTSLLGDEPRSLRRKVREILVAHRLDRALSKDQVFGLYLDHVYLGTGTYGLEDAARYYFGRDAAQLTVSQAAYLAALPKAPDRYRLDRAGNSSLALSRRNWVLSRMAQDGFLTLAARDVAVRAALR